VQFLAHLKKNACEFNGMTKLRISDLAGVLIKYFDTVKPYDSLSIIYHHSYPCVGLHHEPSKYIFTAHFPMIQDGDQLSHFRLLRKAGNYLKVLHFGSDGRASLNRNGFYLDHILQQCHSLVRLYLSNLILVNCGPVPQTYKSIQKLIISNCRLSQQFFQELSVRFQSLPNLYLRNIRIKDSSRNYREGYHKRIIEMPNTTFDTLTWVMDDSSPCFRSRTIRQKYDTLNVEIVTATEPYYYVVSKDGCIAESSPISFVSACNSQNAFSMHIQCQDMRKLNLKVFAISCNIYLPKL
jgi:hypothetical protein